MRVSIYSLVYNSRRRRRQRACLLDFEYIAYISRNSQITLHVSWLNNGIKCIGLLHRCYSTLLE